MASMRLPVLAALLCLAPLLGGCILGGSSPPQLVIEADRAVVSDRVDFNVTLVLERPLTFTTRGCTYPLVHVRVSEERVVPLYGYAGVRDPHRDEGCAAAVTEVTLPAGTYARTVSWNGNASSARPGPHQGERLPPGTYVVEAYLDGMDRSPRAWLEIRLA